MPIIQGTPSISLTNVAYRGNGVQRIGPKRFSHTQQRALERRVR